MRRRAITLGTRGSQLALAQANLVREALLARQPGLEVRVQPMSTRGDRVLDRPLAAIGGKGLFVEEIEAALRAGDLDLAVHSAKDLPSELPADLAVSSLLPRADARDVLIAPAGRLADLPRGARVGTSSPRRACQLRAVRPDLDPRPVRGNVDTRLRKLAAGEVDALVLAAAGLIRLGQTTTVSEWLATTVLLPAATQGALAVEWRADDGELAELLAPLVHPPTQAAFATERAFIAATGGDCTAAVAAHATIADGRLMLVGLVGAPDGRLVRGMRQGPVGAGVTLAKELAGALLNAGGALLLAAGRAAAGSGHA